MKKEFNSYPFGSDQFKEEWRKETEQAEARKEAAETILRQLREARTPCRTAVFERGYIDKVYQDEFSAFYSKAFKSYPARCTRVHFFSDVITPEQLVALGEIPPGYLGYVVLRPSDLNKIGRTCLVPFIRRPGFEFINCRTNFSAHIFGHELQVEAMPFLQQDTHVGACAQAAIWMLARYVSRRFGYREFLPSEVNQLAKASIPLGRDLPADTGLITIQILNALKAMNLAGFMYNRQLVDMISSHFDERYPDESERLAIKLADITYRYIESGLPVILCMDDHAVVAIGHTYRNDQPVRFAIQRTPAFIIHNDSGGPYLHMPVFANKEQPEDPNVTHFSMEDVRSVIAVTPPEVTLKGEEAERIAVASLNKFLNHVPQDQEEKVYEYLARKHPQIREGLGQKEYRTYLVLSTQLQHELREAAREQTLSRDLAVPLIEADYPKYVWVTEVTSHALLQHEDMNARRCMGRILIDSTAPMRTRGALAIQFGGMLILFDRQNPGSEIVRHIEESVLLPQKIICP
jgi:hypothetical protein